ncbi:2-isopropylmalate synthase [Rhodococcus sp. KBS0724]|uniref:2-isopropylmalate synthase n=1 Tax=Rhodococcus sp. KBS0724 TaxID=1179674 RepID=UPI00110D5AEA|nr:2-isopropylmalate synthase [Rhodococcus sp. KBS0724]TSD49123.1 2-isopropylmalate synthase [Rhodococcus sp. KBS0724]
MSTTWNKQKPSPMPSERYRAAWDRVDIPIFERTWPSNRTTAAPLWVPVDLRDGNQALAEPMDPDRKRRMFEMMVAIGYKEIEVGYPSASQTDFDFVRDLVRLDLVPDDVTIVVFTAARKDLIERTYQSIAGLPNAVVHMYTATAPTWRDVVLGKERDELHGMIFRAAEDVARGGDGHDGWRFEFSPEVFNLTEPDYILQVCNSLTELWDASPDRPVVHNLPATVEIATPNIYADQIEYMHHNLARRDSVILSVHPHNDRGTGVACAELAVLAGAQRVEGCLFGNGERTGNVDLVTLGLNLHAQGVDPEIDFTDIDDIRRTVEYCNRIPVHERHPYGGDLVYTAFSGTHQDAIKKGFAHHYERAEILGVDPSQAPWEVPYLPIDPADVGRDYQAVIRVNSQSGKGGIAYLLASEYGVELPRRLQIDFAARVQRETDGSGLEITADQLWNLLLREYGYNGGMRRYSVEHSSGSDDLFVVLDRDGRDITAQASASGPVEALARILTENGTAVDVLSLTQHSLPGNSDSPGSATSAVTITEALVNGVQQWGVAVHQSVTASALHSVYAAASHLCDASHTHLRKDSLRSIVEPTSN